MSTNSKQHQINMSVVRNAWRKRETMFDKMVPMNLRKGKPIVDDANIYQGGIVPHPVVSTQVVYVPDDLFIFIERIIRADPIIRAALDRLTDYTIQNDFHVYFPENKDLARDIHHWMRAHGYYPLMENFARNLYGFGNVFLWKDLRRLMNQYPGRPRNDLPHVIVDHRIVHPAWMFVIRKETGEIKGYVQKRTTTELGWTYFEPEDIIHVPYRVIADRTYGNGIIEPVLRDLHYSRILENDIVEIIHDYVAPLFHVRCGYLNPKTGLNKPASQDSINAIRDYLATLQSNEDIITDNTVEIKAVGAGEKVGDPAPTLGHFKNNMIAGLGVPDFFYGIGQGVSQASAIERTEIVVKTIKASQKLISYTMETQFIPYILLELVRDKVFEDIYGMSPEEFNALGITFKDEKLTGFNRKIMDDYLTVEQIKRVPRMIFNPIESDKDRAVRLREALNSGGLSFNEWRAENFLEPIDIVIDFAGKSLNIGDLTLPVLQSLTQLEVAQSKQETGLMTGNDDTASTGKGQRAPAKKKAGTSTVNGSGQPVARNVKTQGRK